MKADTAPNILKVFKRNGKMLYLFDLRAATFPMTITMITGVLSALLVILFPPLIQTGFVVGVNLYSPGRLTVSELIAPFQDYLTDNWHFVIIFSLMGLVLTLIRKICILNNWAIVKQVNPDIEFRIGYEEIISAIIITSGLCLFSETARYFSIFTFLGAFLFFDIWQYFQDFFIELYVAISNNQNPRKLFSIWYYLIENDTVKLSLIEKIGYDKKTKTVNIIGDIDQKAITNLKEILPEEFEGINQVIIENPSPVKKSMGKRQKKYGHPDNRT